MGRLIQTLTCNAGESIHFDTTKELAIKSFKVYFNPVQEGTGTPSPENVRPITGWDSISLDTARIPKEYQEVEYLESTGEQWIDTGVLPSPTDIYSWDGEFRHIDNAVLFGCRSSGTYTDSNQLYLNRTGTPPTIYLLSNAAGNRVERRNIVIDVDAPYNTKANNISIEGYTTSDFIPTQTIYLLGFNVLGTNSSSVGGGKLSYFSIKGRCNFIPCYRKSDNEPGMYDTVTNTFFTNSGTGTFLVGSDVDHTVTVPLPQTIFGGYVDLVKGDVVEEYERFDIGSLNWSKSIDYLFTVRLGKGAISIPSVMADSYLSKPMFFSDTSDYAIGSVDSSSYHEMLFCRNKDYADLAEFKEANVGKYVVVKHSSPNTIPLSTSQIVSHTLKGSNYIFANTNGKIEIEYEYYDTVNLYANRRKILMNTPHLHSVLAPAPSFKSDMGYFYKDFKIYFGPKQNLNGYDHPWPAGGGTNLFDGNLEVGGLDNAGFNESTTDGIRTTGFIPVERNTTYKVSVGHHNIEKGSMYIEVYYYTVDSYDSPLEAKYTANNTYLNFSISSSGTVKFVRFVFRLMNGYTATSGLELTDISEVQLVKGSATVPYSPYSNICPITGWDMIEVTRHGGNVLNLASHTGSGLTKEVLSDGRSVRIHGTKVGSDGFVIADIDVFDENTLVSFRGLPYLPYNGRGYYIWDNDAEQYIGSFVIRADSFTRTIPAGHSCSLCIDIYSGNTIDMTFAPLCSTASSTDEFSIIFPKTIYGGYVDLIKGELVEEYTYATIDGVNNKLTAGAEIYGDYCRVYNFQESGGLANLPRARGTNYKQLISDMFETRKRVDGNNLVETVQTDDKVNYIRLQLLLSRVGITSSANADEIYQAVNAWLEDNPLNVVYPLATPNTYTIPKRVYRTFKGNNNLYTTSNGNVEIRFYSH